MRNLIQWCGSLGLIMATGVYAADAGPSTKLPDVEYSADRVTLTEDGGRSMQLNMRVNYARGKERNETELHGQRLIMILRHDKKLAWMLISDQHKYMETSYAKQAQYCHWPCVNIEKGKGYTTLGTEAVNGIETTKYKIVCIDKEGKTIEGLFWVADNGVVAKMDFTTTSKGSKPQHAVIELRNLKIAKQDSSLFEIPAGYSEMPKSGMPLGGGMPAGIGGAAGGGAGVKDIMKGLIGR
jgi:hypothetical protein